MKVLFLTIWYPEPAKPNRGIFVRDQAVTIQREHTVELVHARIDYSTFALWAYTISQNNYQGVKENHIIVKRSLPVLNQLVFLWITIQQTIKIALKFQPDIIHGNISYPSAFWSWVVSKVVKRPFVITEHTRLSNNFRSIFHKLLTVRFLKKANAILCVSNSLASEIKVNVSKPVVVVPNIIDFSKFLNIVDVNDSVCQIGFLGTMNTNVKGLDVLLRAVAGIDGEFVLHIGGAGKLLDEYKTIAQEFSVAHKCIFYGFINHDQVTEFMQKLNFFVSASRYESFGMVIVEAMACGLPVVATRCGGPEDFVMATNGLLVEKNNEVPLREAIATMIQRHREYDATHIRNFALNNYSSEQFLKRINEVYTSVDL